MHSRDEVVALAREWLRVRWKHQGRTRNGVDCAGVVVLVGKALGLQYEDKPSYQRRTHGQEFVKEFQTYLIEVSPTDTLPGNVVTFTDSAYPCHCGIFSVKLGVLHIIHAHATRKQVVEEPFAHDWPSRLTHVFQYPGVS